LAADWISNCKLIPQLSAVGTGAISGAGLPPRACWPDFDQMAASILSVEIPIGLLPD
jgi:hypothetical protein